MAQQALGGHHDQRPGVLAERRCLSAQQEEVLRGGRAVGDADVVLGGLLEEALQAAAGVIRPLALPGVRQQQHQARDQAPLGLARDDELVDDDLRAVDEVAVLAFPQDQGVRRLDAVAVLEAERGVFRQRAVVHVERGALVGQRRQGREGCPGCVEERQVALAERAAHGVLAGQAHRHAVGDQRGEGERLGVRPVDRRVGLLEGRPPPLQGAFEFGVHREVLAER